MNANETSSYVSTTELAEGDVIHSYGMVLRLANRREYPADSPEQGACVVFDGVLINADEVESSAKSGDDIARFIWGGVASDMRRKGSDVPVWRVQGNALARWLRVAE